MKQRNKKSLLLLLLLISTQLLCAQAKKAFPGLKWAPASPEYTGVQFGYDAKSFIYDGRLLSKLPRNHAFYQSEEGDGEVYLGSYMNASMQEALHVFFSPGPSADPSFWITDARNNKVWESFADEMCINASGVMYIAGHSDKMFNERRKFQITGKSVREIPQPFLYAGIKGKLLKPAKLYSQKNGGEEVATLPKGYEIEVLLAEELSQSEKDNYELQKNYLARTAFGLVGWLRLTDDDTYYLNPVVSGLGYEGD